MYMCVHLVKFSFKGFCITKDFLPILINVQRYIFSVDNAENSTHRSKIYYHNLNQNVC